MYERARSITPKMQRRLVHDALAQAAGRRSTNHCPRASGSGSAFRIVSTALRQVHFPHADTPLDLLNAFKTRRSSGSCSRSSSASRSACCFGGASRTRNGRCYQTQVDDRIRESLRAVLPFHLTGGQRQALKDIGDDMQRPHPMNRLLQGDVGAGKTIVAVLAAVLAMENGQQVAFMAPTEILAEQHFATLSRLLAARAFRVGLLTGSRRRVRTPEPREGGRGRRAPSCRGHPRARAALGTVSRRSVSSSSTNSTASACCSAPSCARRDCCPTCS